MSSTPPAVLAPGARGAEQLGRCLRMYRARVSPTEAGLPEGPGPRRTPGLRREELATLAGISVDYCARLERGREAHPSAAVIDALARALRLDDAEHDHLRALAARAAAGSPPRPRPEPARTVRPAVRSLLESLRPAPAYVVSRSLDLLAWSPAGLNLYGGLANWPAAERNLARYVFLHPAARDLFPDWENQVRGCVARLRALAGTDPDAPDLARLVGELLLKSPDFARLWERHEVRPRPYGSKTFRHPDVGGLTLDYQSLQLDGTPGHRLVAYQAAPGTPDHDAMTLLDLLDAEQRAVPEPNPR
ncbi:helix-turn-helix transcriptional regulator [Streptacidiphilus jiangxiensis]|uniref:Transcriptional regulator, contains XRE-family HTH domain n=1 Tax=Streptacidiphilus jiangxiensis TaxID=235985 RepID=A0A1H7ZC10_STRJI|nr:helix-turn-helix transcriptional regulator [Streptacidiphilus jiangxiensis]SEM56092.1 Transcriptional regulator, contains XRE-family HTH domain [Streptacidiphilus jiangxiensis]